jgi:hypothetical protein
MGEGGDVKPEAPDAKAAKVLNGTMVTLLGLIALGGGIADLVWTARAGKWTPERGLLALNLVGAGVSMIAWGGGPRLLRERFGRKG